jgi:Uri superfamily endonuclease
VYLLEILAPKSFKIKRKPFSLTLFSEGYYYYTGSAQKNLVSRIERHTIKGKKVHWHIDNITSLEFIKITRVMIFQSASKEFECKLANHLSENYSLSFPVKNFGNSDCRECYSHLLFNKKKIHFNWKEFEIQPVVFYPQKIPI